VAEIKNNNKKIVIWELMCSPQWSTTIKKWSSHSNLQGNKFMTEVSYRRTYWVFTYS
jgi:hypothetical protein